MSKVYHGGAKREDFDAALGLPSSAKIYFAWKQSRWEGEVYREDLLGLYTHSNRLWALVAARIMQNGQMSKWTLPQARAANGDLIEGLDASGPNSGSHAFDPEKELRRAALGYDKLGMPHDIAIAYCEACEKMLNAEKNWNLGLPEAEPESLGEGELDEHGVSTIVGEN